MLKTWLSILFARTIDTAISFCTSFITGVVSKPAHEMGFGPRRKVYFANHSSHGDFVLVWISLPKRWRMRVRPVAGADYWNKGWVRRFLMRQVFNGLLIDRQGDDPQVAIAQMQEALQHSASLIIFPEGTRNTDDDVLLQPFKSGIYHLAQSYGNAEFVPVWLNNIHRVLPKGKLIPVPLLCQVRIGQPLSLQPQESKQAFLERTRNALLALAPEPEQD